MWLRLCFNFFQSFLSSTSLFSDTYFPPLSAKKITASLWFSSHFPSSIFFIRPSCLRTCPSQLCFQHQMVYKILLVSFSHCNTSTFVILYFQLTLHSYPNHISKVSSPFLSANDYVQVSATYSAMLHLWYFITSFFRSRSTLPINKLFLSWRPSSPQQSLSVSQFTSYIQLELFCLLNEFICFTLPLPLWVMHVILVFFALISMPYYCVILFKLSIICCKPVWRDYGPPTNALLSAYLLTHHQPWCQILNLCWLPRPKPRHRCCTDEETASIIV